MPAPKQIDLAFPFKGFSEVAAHKRQPEGTTPGCLNVRPFDAIANRLRGGQRPGLSKFIAGAVNGTDTIQAIDQATLAFDPTDVVPTRLVVDEDFSSYGADGDLPVLNATDWPIGRRNIGDSSSTDAEFAWLRGSNVTDVMAVTAASDNILVTDDRECVLYKDADPGEAYAIKVAVGFDSVTTGNQAGIIFRCDPTGGVKEYYSLNVESQAAGAVNTYLYRWDLSTGVDRRTLVTSETTWAVPGGSIADMVIEVRVNGDTVDAYINGAFLLTGSLSALYTGYRWGFGIGGSTSGSGHDFSGTLDYVQLWTVGQPPVLRETRLVAVSGGNIYAGNADGLAQVGNDDEVNALGDIATQEAYQQTFFADGDPAHYKYLTHSTDQVAEWGTATTTGLPVGTTSAGENLTGVNQGTKTFTATSDLSADIAAGDWIVIAGSTGNDGAYHVVSISGTPSAIVVSQAIPDAAADGTIAKASAACKYLTLYRGRIVMWGMFTDPQNWFMSAVNDPFDWDYAPAETTQTQAVAGNNSDAGLLGDVLLCCAPFSDDLMVMGGDHTLWVMRGDPAAGGVIDNISYQTGIAGPYAYAWDPAGTFYFLGAGELWRLNQGLGLESISAGRLSDTLEDIDFLNYLVRLIWDRDRDSLHIFLVPSSQADAGEQPTHIVWESRTDSFWFDQFPAAVGPFAVHTYDADSPDDRAMLLGGYDSYIRQFDDTAKDDDGTVINSYVWFTPLVTADATTAKVTNFWAELDSTSDPVRLEVHAANDAQALAASTTPRFTRMLSAGRGQPILHKAVGAAINMKLENDSETARSWALESLSAVIRPGGNHRLGVG